MIRTYTRVGRRVADMQVVQRASASVGAISASLDRQLLDERRPTERLRMLREATNQITRAANDAIQAYRRASAVVRAELQMPKGDVEAANEMRVALESARADLLRVLELASQRYAWAEPWPPPGTGGSGGPTPAATSPTPMPADP